MEEHQPGRVVAPQSDAASTVEPPVAVPSGGPEPDRPPAEDPTPESPAPQPETAAPQDATTQAGWQFTADTGTGLSTHTEAPHEVSWTAAEFVAHDKSLAWYGLLALGAVAGTAGLYLITRDKITATIVLVVALFFGVYAARKPRMQHYAIDDYGIHVGNRTYNFGNYRSFSITEEGSVASIIFMPLKRFMPALTIYVLPDNENQVVDVLATLLPFEQHQQDAVDGFLRKIRF